MHLFYTQASRYFATHLCDCRISEVNWSSGLANTSASPEHFDQICDSSRQRVSIIHVYPITVYVHTTYVCMCVSTRALVHVVPLKSLCSFYAANCAISTNSSCETY